MITKFKFYEQFKIGKKIAPPCILRNQFLEMHIYGLILADELFLDISVFNFNDLAFSKLKINFDANFKILLKNF